MVVKKLRLLQDRKHDKPEPITNQKQFGILAAEIFVSLSTTNAKCRSPFGTSLEGVDAKQTDPAPRTDGLVRVSIPMGRWRFKPVKRIIKQTGNWLQNKCRGMQLAGKNGANSFSTETDFQ